MATIAADKKINERSIKRQQKYFDDEQFLVDVESNDAEEMDQNRLSIRQETVTWTEKANLKIMRESGRMKCKTVKNPSAGR